MGMKSGLIKSNGNLIKTVRIIVLDGVSVGGAESIRLNEENAKAATKTPSIIIKIFNEVVNQLELDRHLPPRERVPLVV